MLKIETTKEANYHLIQLIGEVDASNSVALDEAIVDLIEQDAKNILIDGTQLEYISSAGLGVFMSYIEDFEEKNILQKSSIRFRKYFCPLPNNLEILPGPLNPILGFRTFEPWQKPEKNNQKID